MNPSQYPKHCPFCQAEQTEPEKRTPSLEEESVRRELRSLGVRADVPPGRPSWRCGTTLPADLTAPGFAKARALGMDAALYERSELCRQQGKASTN